MTDYLSSAIRQFKLYKELGEKTFAQLSDEQLFWAYNDESNNIGTIVKHLSGNMISRWMDFLTADGEKEWRNRDTEFEDTINTREELLEAWNKGWQCVFDAITPLTTNDLNQTILIRNEPHTVLEAINRQMPHYAYHIGQIVYIGKMVQDDNWTSLSIPKGGSEAYNDEKFST